MNGFDAPWQAPQEHVHFGDIFKSAWLLDLFVRDDARLMGGDELGGNLVVRLGKWLNATLPAETIALFSPAFTPKPADRYALAHAAYLPGVSAHHAILVSDSCLVATALVQGRTKRSVSGRLLFAPVRGVSADDYNKLSIEVDFGRMPLPGDAQLPDHPVAELRHCFMVDAVHLKAHTDDRVLACSHDLAEDVAAHWTAYAARRGPLAYERNALKLAYLLAGAQAPGDDEVAVTDTIAAALDLAWALESSDLEDVSDSEEAVRLDGADPAQHADRRLDDLTARLRELAEAATQSADALQSRR